MSNATLMAVPLFIMMGLILEKSGMAEKLLLSMSAMFKGVRGGLGVSVVLVGAILAASTGIVSASVVMMSVIALPLMLQAGYDKSLASGTIAASGTLGQIIPPSIILIILGDVMSVSVVYGRCFTRRNACESLHHLHPHSRLRKRRRRASA